MCVRGDSATGIRDHDLRNCLRTDVLAGCGLGNLTSNGNDVDDWDDDGHDVDSYD